LYGDKYNYIPANYTFTEDPSRFNDLKKIYGVANSLELDTISQISLYESFRIKEDGYYIVYGKSNTVVNIEPESNQTLIKTLKLITSEGECEYDISTDNNGCGDKLTVNKSNGQIDNIILTFTKEESYTLQYKYEDDADFHLMNAGDEQGNLESKNIKLLNSILSENIKIPDASEGGTYSLIDDYNSDETPGEFNIKFDVNGDFKLSGDAKSLYYKINLYNSADNKVPVLDTNGDNYVGTLNFSNNLNELNTIGISNEILQTTIENNFTNKLDTLKNTDYAMQICFSLDKNFDDNKTVCKETNSDKKINLYPQINVLFTTENFINTYSIFDPYGLIYSTGPTIADVEDYKTKKGETLKSYIVNNEYSDSDEEKNGVKVILEYNSNDLKNLYYSDLYLNSFKSIPELTTIEHVNYTVKIYYKILGEIRNTEPKENDISSKGYSLGRSQVRINREIWYSYFLSIDNDNRANALESLLETSNKLIISNVGDKPIIIYKDESVFELEKDKNLIEKNSYINYLDEDTSKLAVRDGNTFTYYSSTQQFQIDCISLYVVTDVGSQKTAEFVNSTTQE